MLAASEMTKVTPEETNEHSELHSGRLTPLSPSKTLPLSIKTNVRITIKVIYTRQRGILGPHA